MEVINKIDDAVGDTIGKFDLPSENVGGLFTNMTLLSMLLMSIKDEDKPFPITKDEFEPVYDYIIVGGGTAGSVMAYRLSEIPCINILLLEAGGQPPLLTEIPSYARIFYESEIDWLYMSEPQKDCALGQKDNRIKLNNGKVLGGSSTINAMLYVRGSHENYNEWEREGCTGWGYKHVKKYFKKLEDNKNMGELDKGYHREGGPLTVMKPRYHPEIRDPLLEAAKDLGHKIVDINGKRMTGIYDLQANMRNCQRCSTAKAYLRPASKRPNLTILKRAFVTKIIMKGKRAIGVEFDYKGKTETVHCFHEVVVSAGTIRAPQLLMLAGIGPKKHLEEMGIDCIEDLPVGQNFQDHYATSLNYKIDPLIQNVVLKSINPLNIAEYATKRSGPLCAPNQVNLMAFLDGSNKNCSCKDFPRQELYFAEYSAVDAKNYNLKPETFLEGFSKYSLSSAMTCIASLTQPESRGEVTLKSTDPHDYPRIDPRYYTAERDIRDVVEAMKLCNSIATHKAMKKVKAKPFEVNYPWCAQHKGNQTATFACMAKTIIQTFWHFVGTCRMGQKDDKRSVVDIEGKVIGIDGLRVVCAAIIPIVTTGNTNIPTMMVAEKIADEMKKNIKCDGWKPEEENPEEEDEEEEVPSCKCKKKKKGKGKKHRCCKRKNVGGEKPEKTHGDDDCDYH